MTSLKRLLSCSTWVGIGAGLLLPVTGRAQTFYTVAPTATYLRTNSDNPTNPTVIFLDALGGNTISLLPGGQYSVAGSDPPGRSAVFWAVFSSSNTFLPDNGVLKRVPGALDVGFPLDTTAVAGPTFYGNVPMDIPQDFFIPSTGLNITVPHGAHYLFVGIPDNYYGDNSSPDPSQLGLTVTTTPEPTSMALLGTGLIGLVPMIRRRKTSV